MPLCCSTCQTGANPRYDQNLFSCSSPCPDHEGPPRQGSRLHLLQSAVRRDRAQQGPRSTGPVTSPHHPQYSSANLRKLVRGSSSHRVRYCDDMVRYGDMFFSCQQAHRSNRSVIRLHRPPAMGRRGCRRGLPSFHGPGVS